MNVGKLEDQVWCARKLKCHNPACPLLAMSLALGYWQPRSMSKDVSPCRHHLQTAATFQMLLRQATGAVA